ncbi:MAG: hypothetical protein PVG41_21685 [Desulfobacteraceae bacterium]|jgi:hypothetical protein
MRLICFVYILFVFSALCSCQSSSNDQDENNLPTIGGSPAGFAVVDETYSFTPTAGDPDDDILEFSIDNKPDWALFDSASGSLTGSPAAGDIGTYSGILISVSDGLDSASLAAFSITVLEASSGEVKNHTGIPLPHVLLTHDPDGKGSDWQANPEPWPSDPRTAETPSRPAGWPSSAVEDHWFIDNTHPNATDSDTGDNAVSGTVYGTPDRPRLTLPGTMTFRAGSYIEIHGGPYNSGAGLWRFQCTDSQPCWVTSDPNDKAVLAGSAYLSLEGSSWVTIENLMWDPEAPGAERNTRNTAISTNYNGTRGDTHHVVLRHIDFRRWSYISGGGGIISVSSNNLEGGTEAHHILIYDVSAVEAGNTADRGCDWTENDCDNHLVGVSTRISGGVTTNSTHHVWVLDSRSDRIAGNQVQAISLGGTVNVDWRETVHHIYMGGNTHSDSRQSGWWAKRSSNFIVSSCRSFGNRDWTGGNGQASGMQYGPDWVWFINNDFHDSDFGIQQTSTNAEDSPADNGRLFVLGNRFYNIRRFSDPTKTDPWRGGFAVAAWSNNATHYIAFNTCVDCESGLATKVHALNNPEDGAYVWNNIVYGIDENVGDFIAYNPNGYVWAHNNLFWNESIFNVYWSGTYGSLTDWESAHSARVYDNIHADPLLTNTLTTWPERDYSLMTGSPALESDAGASIAADGTDPFALYLERYGTDIARDVAGNPRTVPYSPGAYE